MDNINNIKRIFDEYNESINFENFKHFMVVDGTNNKLLSYKIKSGKIKVDNIKTNFSSYIKRKINKYCIEQDKAYLLKECNLDYIICQLKKHSFYKIVFGFIDDKIGFREKELRFYSVDTEKNLFLIVLNDVTDDFIMEEKQNSENLCIKNTLKDDIEFSKNETSFLNNISYEEETIFDSELLLEKIKESVRAKEVYCGVKVVIDKGNFNGKYLGKINIITHIITSVIMKVIQKTDSGKKVYLKIKVHKRNNNIVYTEFIIYDSDNIDKKTIIEQTFHIYNSNSKPSIKLSNGSKLNILVVESQQLNFVVIKNMLLNENIELHYADNGQEAFDKFLESKDGFYSAVLMDIRMPKLDGQEATYKIRIQNRKDSKEIPIIGMITYAYPEDRQKSLDSGMTDLLEKPIEKDKLIQILNKYIA